MVVFFIKTCPAKLVSTQMNKGNASSCYVGVVKRLPPPPSMNAGCVRGEGDDVYTMSPLPPTGPDDGGG